MYMHRAHTRPLKSNHNNKVSKISNHHLQSRWGRNKRARQASLSLHILTRFITRIKKWPCDAPADACAPLHYFMLDLVVENWRAPPVVKSARIMKCSASRGAQRTPPPTIVHKSSGWFNHFNRRQAARCSLAATVRSLNCPLCVQKVHCCNYEQSCLLPLTLLFTGWNNCFFALLNEQSSALF